MPWVAERAPEGWKIAHQHQAGGEDLGYEPLSDNDEAVDDSARKRAWARLLAKVYEVDPMTCPKVRSGHEPDHYLQTNSGRVKVTAVIENPDGLGRILRHLVTMGRSPPGFDPDRLN